MRGLHAAPTGIERTFGDNELIVSKTDLSGRITYANELFVSLSGYTRQELMGACPQHREARGDAARDLQAALGRRRERP